jgi:hypothetical protein
VGAGSYHPHSRLKQAWLQMLRAGAGSLVVAVAVVSAPPAQAARLDTSASLNEKVEQARHALKGPPLSEANLPSPDLLAYWGNHWGNGGWGWHPYWHNWPNWHNWHNWHNWGNH